MKKTRDRKYFAPQNRGKKRQCDHEGCDKAGEYRAPKDKSLKEYFWFCLEHVQEYNKSWNFYAGEEDFVEEEAEEPNKRFSNFSSKVKYNFFDYDDYHPKQIYWTAKEQKYLTDLELSKYGVTLDLLRQQYKKLVKKYHPDVNAGNKEKEEKFKLISVAYKAIEKKLTQAK
ncbi:MAG: DnaJ domain-containing protein [Alphaproteobacteria bacterium]